MAIPSSAFRTHPAGLLRRGFELAKWYVDVVAPDGRGAIAYWVELTWHGVRGRAASLLTFGPDEPTVERTTLDAGAAPSWHGRTLDWALPSLDATILLHGRTPGAATRLLDHDGETLDWNCVAPHGPACIARGGRSIDGVGYAECLRTSVPPWRLPAAEVRWGRALFEDRSVVWLEWTGAAPRALILVDGHPVPGTIHPDCIDLPRGERLLLAAPHVIRDGSVAEAVRPVRVLWPLLPQALRETREQKWLSQARLQSGEGHEERAWAIHELVTLHHS
jgi:hypothetical protein